MFPSAAALAPNVHFRSASQRSRNKDAILVRISSLKSLRNLIVLMFLSMILIIWSSQIGAHTILTSVSDSISSLVGHNSKRFQRNVSLEHMILYRGNTTASTVSDKLQHADPGREASRVKDDELHDGSSGDSNEQQPPMGVTESGRERVEGASSERQETVNEVTQRNDSTDAPTHKIKLSDVLNFTTDTAINFMHFHKTGGVSFKSSLHKFYHKKVKANGERVLVRDACYSRVKNVKKDPSKPSFLVWRCDWEPLREMSEEERNKHDFVIGHQFWVNGATMLLNQRDLRTFTVLRHPLDRKVSFYYHFFVRELGRNESDVSFDELRDFVLRNKVMTDGKLGRDLGPNYMAGRLLSDGMDGFVGDQHYSHYAVNATMQRDVVRKSVRLMEQYVFVGLQEQPGASKCMLRRVVEAFNEVNDIDNDGVNRIDKEAKVLNSGSYDLDARTLWKRFSDEERALFENNEAVDLSIYGEGKKLFQRHVQQLRCAHRLADEV